MRGLNILITSNNFVARVVANPFADNDYEPETLKRKEIVAFLKEQTLPKEVANFLVNQVSVTIGNVPKTPVKDIAADLGFEHGYCYMSKFRTILIYTQDEITLDLDAAFEEAITVRVQGVYPAVTKQLIENGHTAECTVRFWSPDLVLSLVVTKPELIDNVCRYLEYNRLVYEGLKEPEDNYFINTPDFLTATDYNYLCGLGEMHLSVDAVHRMTDPALEYQSTIETVLGTVHVNSAVDLSEEIVSRISTIGVTQ